MAQSSFGGGKLPTLSLQNHRQSLIDNETKDYSISRMKRMYNYPAIMQEALMHKKANEFGYNSKNLKDGKPAPICPCCELPINTYRIQMNEDTTPSKQNVKVGQRIFLLNAGTAMFFTFIKMTIVYLFIRFLLSDCYNLITNIISHNCDQQVNAKQCDNNIVARFSSYNKNYDQGEAYSYVVDILNLVTVVCSIIFFFYYRKKQYQIYEVADVSQISQSDFSIFVEKIPYFLPYDPNQIDKEECLYQETLKKLFEDHIREWIKRLKQSKERNNKLDQAFYQKLKSNPSIEKQPIVCSISLCFDLTEMEKMNKIRDQLMAKHNENVQKNINLDESSPLYVPNQIQKLNHQYIQLSRRFCDDSTMAFNLSHFVGRAFVSFQYEHYKEYFLEYFKDTDKLKISDTPLKVGTAANPSDVYWFNMKVSSHQRRVATIYSAFVVFMALVFAFAALFFLQYAQLLKTAPQKTNELTEEVVLSYVFTISMSILTTVINMILAAFCQKLTQLQRHKSTTDRIFSLMVKSVFSQFINTAFIYYVFAVVVEITHPEKSHPLNENGLVMKVTSLVAISGAVSIGLNAVQIGSLFNCVLNKFKLKGETINMFQVELNKNLQDPQFDFADRYSYYIVNVFVVSFFSYITPYISIILIFIFIAQYWVDKYNLFRRFSCPIDFDFRLSRMTLKFFQTSVLIFAIGNYLFGKNIHTKDNDSYQVINLISLALAGAYSLASLLLPKKLFQRIDVESYETSSYTECLNKQKFNKVYWLTNPATSFAQEYDLNDYNKFVNYGGIERFAQVRDYDQFLSDEQHGRNLFETYDKEDANIIANQIVHGFLVNPNSGEPDVLSFMKNATAEAN